MGVVNTSYTFTATDTITSAKMNNIIDDTIMTSTAVSGTTLQVTTSGQLAVNSQGITSNELASNAVITAKIADSSITQAKLGANVIGNGPCFKIGDGSNAVVSGVATKLTMTTISFDTNNNVANSRFTPNIAGYYQFNARTNGSSSSLSLLNCYIYKNGAVSLYGSTADSNMYISSASGILYLNGSGDYVELYAKHSTAGTQGIVGHLDGVLVRSA